MDAKITNALMVMITTPHILEYLQANDPTALRQAKEALHIYSPVEEDEEQRLGTIVKDELGLFIEDYEFGLAMSLPQGITFPVGEKVKYSIPNPTPGVFVEEFHNKVSHVESIVMVQWGIS